jgi:hypothetical protein
MKAVLSNMAMPQLIHQEDLNMAFVLKWKKVAEMALRNKKLTPIRMENHVYPLFHCATSKTSGVWFISGDRSKVDYLYAYFNAKVDRKTAVIEALAYLFTEDVRGVTKEVFFSYLLPYSKFVVTDSMYTPDAERWFGAEYVYAFCSNGAFNNGYKVYAFELSKGKTTNYRQVLTIDEFNKMKDGYWGLSGVHQKYRFAIEQVTIKS